MTASSVTFGRKAVILAVIISVIAMFVTSFIYRMNHPNLFVQTTQQAGPQQPADHDHDGDGIQDDGPNAGKPTSEVMNQSGGMGQGMGSMGMVKEFIARVEANPNDVEALVGLGNAFMMMRAWDRALEPLQKANTVEPGNVMVLKSIGLAHFNKEEFKEASSAYDQILEIDPNDSLALFNQGVIFKYYFENKDAARTYFEKVLEVEKEDEEVIKMAKQELEN